jgi:hypothetical protein
MMAMVTSSSTSENARRLVRGWIGFFMVIGFVSSMDGRKNALRQHYSFMKCIGSKY